MMLPPYTLVPFYLVLSLLCFPPDKLPLSLLPFEKRLYLREQNTGRGTGFLSYHAAFTPKGEAFPFGGKGYCSDLKSVGGLKAQSVRLPAAIPRQKKKPGRKKCRRRIFLQTRLPPGLFSGS